MGGNLSHAKAHQINAASPLSSTGHFVVNATWSAADFVAASERLYANNIKCTELTGRKLCIVTLLSGLKSSYKRLLVHNHGSYARMHNYTYCHSDFAPPDREAPWAKILELAALLHQCRSLMWIDADAILSTNPALSMAPALQQLERYEVILSGRKRGCRSEGLFSMDNGLWGEIMTLVGEVGRPVNSGTFLLRSGSFAAEMLHALYARPFGIRLTQRIGDYYNNYLWENAAVNEFLRMAAHFAHFSDKIGFAFSDAINCMPFEFEPGCRVLHAPGTTLKGMELMINGTVVRSGGFSGSKYERLERLLSTCFVSSGSAGQWHYHQQPQPRIRLNSSKTWAMGSTCQKLLCGWSLFRCNKLAEQPHPPCEEMSAEAVVAAGRTTVD